MESTDARQELDRIYHPRAVAVVGVTDRVTNQGLSFLEAHRNMGFKGGLYAIHPSKTIPGFDTYPSLMDIPGPVDYVVIAIPAGSVPEVVSDCVRKKVRCASIFSSGFSESPDRERAELEKKLAAVAAGSGLRLLGPNCMGLYCPESGLSIRPEVPTPENGNLGLICQSGGITISLILAAGSRGMGISKGVSYGNEVDLGPPEFLSYMSSDPETEVICLYIEGTRRPEQLQKELQKAARIKPVIVLKGGSTAAGGRAVASHTGAMAGSSEIWSSIAARAGAVTARDTDEMLDLAGLFSMSRPPPGPRIGVLTISGGLGVVAADVVSDAGFQVPQFSDDTRERLAKLMNAPGTSVQNPMDMAAQFYRPEVHGQLFATADSDPGIDAFLLVAAVEYLGMMGEKARENAIALTRSSIEAMQAMKKPVYVALLHTAYDDLRAELEREFLKAGFPVFPTLQRCLSTLSLSRRAGKYRRDSRNFEQ